MLVYNYNKKGVYIGKSECLLDPLESIIQKNKVYLLPTNSTFVEIPKYDNNKQYLVFEDNSWNIKNISKAISSALTDGEKQAAYDALSVKYIHEKYSYDDENRIMREYLSDMNNAGYKTMFEVYNVLVEECKQKAHKEVYGNE